MSRWSSDSKPGMAPPSILAKKPSCLCFSSVHWSPKMIQWRQFRKDHCDSHYAAAVFKYMRAYAEISNCLFMSLDDKHRIKVGEPGYPVASAEHGRRVIAKSGGKDHNFYKV